MLDALNDRIVGDIVGEKFLRQRFNRRKRFAPRMVRPANRQRLHRLIGLTDRGAVGNRHSGEHQVRLAIRQQLLSRFRGGQVMVFNLQIGLMTELINHKMAIY